jgi:hypothetical protein
MVSRGAVCAQRGQVPGRQVTHVSVHVVQAQHRLALHGRAHHVVACGLGKNAGGGDADVSRVAGHHTRVRHVSVSLEHAAVDQHVRKMLALQLVQGGVHGTHRGAQYVVLVDVLDAC